jgi:tRNA pseudouridine38-40 synthase
MPRYKLTIEYDGTGFVGWQRQDNGTSVQEAVEQAILGFCGEAVTVAAAGRTDAGVHALGQVAHADLSQAFPVRKVRDAINDHLRRGATGARRIAVLEAEEVGDDFHARFSATGRRYRYRIVNRPAALALDRDRALHVFSKLDTGAMQLAADRLVGRHDFTTFRSVHCQADSPVKTLDVLAVTRVGDELTVEAVARSFLHNQVRAMTGTLVRVGEGKMSVDEVTAALAARDRARCGPTAPAHGLTFVEVTYGEKG